MAKKYKKRRKRYSLNERMQYMQTSKARGRHGIQYTEGYTDCLMNRGYNPPKDEKGFALYEKGFDAGNKAATKAYEIKF